MFARFMFQTEDMGVQHKLLNQVADLIDNFTLITTANYHGGEMSVQKLLGAHERQKSGSAIDKTVRAGRFQPGGSRPARLLRTVAR